MVTTVTVTVYGLGAEVPDLCTVLPTEKLVVCRWVNWSRDCVMIFVALADSL